MFCSKCGQESTPDSANFCWNCGMPLQSGTASYVYCRQCGKPLVPTSALHCWSCGFAQQGEAIPSENVGWEVCEIGFRYEKDDIVPTLKAYVTFIASAVGPAGAYTAARSETFEVSPDFHTNEVRPDRDRREDREALEQLKTKLIDAGWKIVGEGDEWYNLHLRRRVI